MGDLDAIIEAGKRLRTVREFSQEWWDADREYERLSRNHADTLALRVKELEAKLELVRGFQRRLEDSKESIHAPNDRALARELAALLAGEQ